MSNLSQSPYLRQQRQFPSDDLMQLARQSDQAYIDVAQKVNDRTIGLFAINTSIITGEKWFLAGSSGNKQTLRKLFSFTASGNIAHGVTLSDTSGVTKVYGTFTDGTNWYPLPYVDEVSATNQVSVKVTPTNIVITRGAGSPPTITSGWVTMEYLSNA